VFTLTGYARGIKLLHPAIIKGERLFEPESLLNIQGNVKKELMSLKTIHKKLTHPEPYQVTSSEGLQKLKRSLMQDHER
jgi:hypothetical protein